AERTPVSTSTACERANNPQTSPVVGLTVSNVSPPAGVLSTPSMKFEWANLPVMFVDLFEIKNESDAIARVDCDRNEKAVARGLRSCRHPWRRSSTPKLQCCRKQRSA